MTIDKSASAIPMHDKSANRLRKTIKVNGPASYLTGGDAVTGAELGMSKIHVWPNVAFTNGTVIIHSAFDYAAQKLKFFVVAGTQVPPATDLSAYSATIEVIGR